MKNLLYPLCVCVECGDDIFEREVEWDLSDGFRCPKCMKENKNKSVIA